MENNNTSKRKGTGKAPRKDSARKSYGTRKNSEDRHSADKPRRSFGRRDDDDKPRRSFGRRDGDDKPRRSFGHRDDDDKPRRSFGRRDDDDKPRRSFGRRDDDDKPRRSFGRRDGDDKPRRSFGRRDDDDKPRRSFGRRDDDDKPRRSFGRRDDDDKPRRSFGRRDDDDKPRRSFGRRDGDDKPHRSFGRRDDDDKPHRSFGRRDDDDKPHRSFGRRDDDDKPRRSFGRRDGDDKPRRSGAPTYAGVSEYTPKPRKNKSGSKSEQSETQNENNGVRLNKYIANSGVCSRREADEYIQAGLVKVNDVIITQLGSRVMPGDVVKFNDETLKGEEKVYILMNKPKDFVTTVSDPHAEHTVLDLISGKCSERVYPVGRLDKSTTGVLLITNDGEITDKLTHPSFEKKKIYQVTLDRNLKRADMETILNGITLEDGFIQADNISYLDGKEDEIGIEIHSGRNRLIRRIFESLDYKVKKLDRVYFAGLTKKNLRRGQWRFLTEQEVGMLKMGSFE